MKQFLIVIPISLCGIFFTFLIFYWFATFSTGENKVCFIFVFMLYEANIRYLQTVDIKLIGKHKLDFIIDTVKSSKFVTLLALNIFFSKVYLGKVY